MKLQGSGPSAPKSLQSQNRPRPENRLSISRLDVVHGQLAIVAAIALSPAPAGLALYAWYYFAIFAGVIAALVVEPLSSPAIGVIGVTTVTVLSPWVLFSPTEIA